MLRFFTSISPQDLESFDTFIDVLGNCPDTMNKVRHIDSKILYRSDTSCVNSRLTFRPCWYSLGKTSSLGLRQETWLAAYQHQLHIPSPGETGFGSVDRWRYHKGHIRSHPGHAPLTQVQMHHNVDWNNTSDLLLAFPREGCCTGHRSLLGGSRVDCRLELSYDNIGKEFERGILFGMRLSLFSWMHMLALDAGYFLPRR